MQELDRLANEIPTVEVRRRHRPDQLREEGEECRDDVGDGEVEHVEVGPAGDHVGPASEDAGHDAEVAKDRHQDDARHHGDLCKQTNKCGYSTG